MAKATGQEIDVLRKTPPYQWDPGLKADSTQLSRQQAAHRAAGLLSGEAVVIGDLVT
ncbi:hypothetical protein [Streptomyces sp. NPDC088725]|uniref:hypothetical protein n=1 Tax=Streptomyces sp. NPDC088725 TaxID=3365873 RepID=UPI00380DC808